MLQTARDQHRRQKQTARATAAALSRLWLRHIRAADLDGSFSVFASLALPYLIGAQRAAVEQAISYLPLVLAEQGISDRPLATVDPYSLSGVASDGRDLDTLLRSPVTVVKRSIAAGLTDTMALASGLVSLRMISQTQVQDAGRVATGLGIVTRPNVGYVRALDLPSCPRCVILAGRFYKWNDGFQRHPLCDCLHIPSTAATAEGATVDPTAAFRAGQVRGLSEADQQAIADGADMSQVVNAHRGMSTAQEYGRNLRLTSEGTTRRGLASQRLRRGPRLMPETIYRLAGDDHSEALRLLVLNGYIR